MLKREDVRQWAIEAGFDLCGFARPEKLPPEFLSRWLEAGMDADMDWLSDRLDERLDVSKLLPNVQTVMALACNYFYGDTPSAIARYARGRDYHYNLTDRIRALRRAFKKHLPDIKTYSSVDFGPVMEKVWAVKAGLGFVGKNGCLITPKYGSWVVLATFMLDVEMDAYDEPFLQEQCGQCRLCLDACPTHAIDELRQVDSRKCLSYQTIENEGAIPVEFRHAMEDVVFGCDICQTVCPLNNFPLRAHARFVPRPISNLSVRELASLSQEQFTALAQGTPLARVQYDGLRRNAVYALGAAKDAGAKELLEGLMNDGSEKVREAAWWALSCLKAKPSSS